jgi:CheY-like chemotaxis protein
VLAFRTIETIGQIETMKKITLLIIDDEQEVVNALAAIFRPNKRYKVRAHSSVAAARADLAAFPPQLLLCDYLMPECDGIEVVRELKQRFPQLRSILLTGQMFDENIVKGLEQGLIDLYIAKPWNQAELEDAVKRLAREVAKGG